MHGRTGPSPPVRRTARRRHARRRGWCGARDQRPEWPVLGEHPESLIRIAGAGHRDDHGAAPREHGERLAAGSVPGRAHQKFASSVPDSVTVRWSRGCPRGRGGCRRRPGHRGLRSSGARSLDAGHRRDPRMIVTLLAGCAAHGHRREGRGRGEDDGLVLLHGVRLQATAPSPVQVSPVGSVLNCTLSDEDAPPSSFRRGTARTRSPRSARSSRGYEVGPHRLRVGQRHRVAALGAAEVPPALLTASTS